MSNIPVQLVLGALRAKDLVPFKSGDGWMCRCPAHHDRQPSLSISEGDDGRALIHCHAGCPTAAVVAVIGLTLRDLMSPSTGTVTETSSSRTNKRVSVTRVNRSLPDVIANLERKRGSCSSMWTYTDAAGDPVGVILRWSGSDGKRFLPVSKNGPGWYLGGMPGPRPLYRLHELARLPAGARVFVVEGEKAADAARSIGLVTTTSPHGSRSAAKADWSPLLEKDVVILPDHDSAGEAYAVDVTRLARAAGAESVRVLRLAELFPGVPVAGDIDDLVRGHCGGTESLAKTILEHVEAIPKQTSSSPQRRRHRSFPLEVFPRPLRAYVEDGARAHQCDPAFIALPLLSALAAAVGASRCIRLSDTWDEPCIVWTGVIAESGAGKTHSARHGLKFVYKRQDRAYSDHKQHRQEHAGKMAQHEREMREWKQSNAASDPPVEPEEPSLQRFTTDDVTVEALAGLLSNNPRGILVATDELSGFFRSFDAYRNGRGRDLSRWLALGSSSRLEVDRKGTPMICVANPCVSMTGGVQPGVLPFLLKSEFWQSGLVARFLFASPPTRPRRWQKAVMDKDLEAQVGKVFDALFGLQPRTGEDDTLVPQAVALSPEADAIWGAFHDRHHERLHSAMGAESAALAKLVGYAARLALIIHLVRAHGGAEPEVLPGVIDERSMRDGVVLVEWFTEEVLRIYETLCESEEDRQARELLKWVERQRRPVSPAEVAHGVRRFRSNAESAELALMALVASGRGSWVNAGNGYLRGRPTRKFVVSPDTAVTETASNRGDQRVLGDSDKGKGGTS